MGRGRAGLREAALTGGSKHSFGSICFISFKRKQQDLFFFSRGPEVPLVSISEIYTYYLHIYNGYSHLFLQIVK